MSERQGDLPLDNPMLVRWEFASEERLATRNAIYRRLIEGQNAEDVLLEAVVAAAPKRVLEVGCGAGEMSQRIHELGCEAAKLAPELELSQQRELGDDGAGIEPPQGRGERHACAAPVG